MSASTRSSNFSNHPSPARKSNRERRRPIRFVARPSKQGLSVEDGDAIFSIQPQMQLSDGQIADAMAARRSSNRIREQRTDKPGEETFQSEGGRIMPMRGARNRSKLHHEDYTMTRPTNTVGDIKSKHESKRMNSKKRVAAAVSVPELKGSGGPRKPRVIVIGAGISGLACARELSERRHDVLVLEARNRLGGRLRTVDLMMEDVSDKASADNESSDLFKVSKWSSVDVGGAFIHGTGQYTTRTDDSTNVGSHDFGTSKSKAKSTTTEQPKHENLRKSSRLSINYDELFHKQSKEAVVNNRKLNPVYVFCRKLRLPVQAAEGAFTCLVDHEGNLISEQVDQEVSREFNEVLDLATKCCESGLIPVLTDKMGSAKTEQSAKLKKKQSPRKAIKCAKTGGESPNYISDDTENSQTATEWKKLDPSTDFGTIFEECRQYNRAVNENARTYSPKEMEVRNHLFQWHVANLEMSSGAPMHKLGQRWNDDEPFGYGGDHSYLETGFRDVIEALSDGFECRGVGDKSFLNDKNWARRSGDLAGCFYLSQYSGVALAASQSRGIIQCGIEVNGVEIVEKADAKMLRKRRRVSSLDASNCRRSSRHNKGSKMTDILGSLSNRQHAATDEIESEPSTESDKIQSSVYGSEGSTVVRVTSSCGLTFEADAVVVTLPLAILKIPPDLPGHITFSPPLPKAKQNALSRLGVGTYNKCIMSFSHPFWKHLPRHLSSSSTEIPSYWNDPSTHRFDFIGHASNEHGKDILFFNIRNAPVLVAIYGGSDYSKEIEKVHDKEVVAGCMNVLRKIFSKATSDCRLRRSQINDLTVPDWPLDYFVSRWGSDPFSRGSFSFIPQGVDGIEELNAMSQPIYDYEPEGTSDADAKPRRPLVLFAGEGTNPYHPSTIHGAFETGIREAYRLDYSLEPGLNQFKFNESYLYQPTFSARPVPSETKQDNSFGAPKADASNKLSFTAVGDALILRGVETFSSSSDTFHKIKEKMLDQDVASVDEIKTRYGSLVRMLSQRLCGQDKSGDGETRWVIPGKKMGTWLSPDVPQTITKVAPNKTAVAKVELAVKQSRSGRKIQRKTYNDCIYS